MASKDILNKYATEIRNENLDMFKPDNKTFLMFINYNCGGYLGQAVINDGVYFASHLHTLYKCYYISNSSVNTAKELIKKLVSSKGEHVIYYSGHGTQVKDYNGDETDGRDEAFVFKNGYLVDDEAANILNNNFACDKLILFADCCHCGTIWDLNAVKNNIKDKITCISACDDNQTSKQLFKNGCFTLQFWRLYDMKTKTININELNNKLKIFDQTAIIYPMTNKENFKILF